MHCHDRIGGEDEFGSRPGKTNEGEARQDGGEGEPANDLARRDHMTVRRCRVHLAITDRRQCLDAEEEGIRDEKLFGRARAIEPGTSQKSAAKTTLTER